MLDRLASWLAGTPKPAPPVPRPVLVQGRRQFLTWHGRPVETCSKDDLVVMVYALTETIDKLETALLRMEGLARND